MDEGSRRRKEASPAKAVTQIVYGERAIADIERAFEFLVDEDPSAAVNSAVAISEAVELLAQHPLIGRRVDRQLRELVISFGKTGYVALYRFIAERREIRILAIRHQRELDFGDG